MRVKVKERFYGIAEQAYFEVGKSYDFSDERAGELARKGLVTIEAEKVADEKPATKPAPKKPAKKEAKGE